MCCECGGGTWVSSGDVRSGDLRDNSGELIVEPPEVEVEVSTDECDGDDLNCGWE